MKTYFYFLSILLAVGSMRALANEPTTVEPTRDDDTVDVYVVDENSDYFLGGVGDFISGVVDKAKDYLKGAVNIGSNVFKKGGEVFVDQGGKLVALTAPMAYNLLPSNIKAMVDEFLAGLKDAKNTGNTDKLCDAMAKMTSQSLTWEFALIAKIAKVNVPEIVSGNVAKAGGGVQRLYCNAAGNFMRKLNQ